MDYKIHQSADVSPDAKIGAGTKIWNWVQVRENTEIGENCILSKGVYIDSDVKIGNNVKIQNNVSVYHGVEIGNGVFVGPHVCFTNDKNPRAIDIDGNLKGNDDWEVSEIHVGDGVAIGANSTILPGVTLNEYCMVGAGSVVTKDVPAYTLVFGNPAQIRGKVDKAGNIVERV